MSTDETDDGRTGDPYDLRRASATADRMLARYSSGIVASDMAHWHAMDHARGTAGREYWQTVGAIIRRRSQTGAK